ncbi:MAG TPA: hypothetical protein VGO47_13690 [Chlamydiales bacterium]|jgi:hypothetical protein|nr:hypothetical protein [Chlamydiales bacterium]
MCVSVFLALVIGAYLVLVSLAMLIQHQHSKRLLNEFYANHALVVFSGQIWIILGLLLIVGHNVWEMEWPVIITIAGWVMLLQGIYRVFAPMLFSKKMKELQARKGYDFIVWAWLIVGLYMIWVGVSNT